MNEIAVYITIGFLILAGTAVWARNAVLLVRRRPMLPREPREEIRWNPSVVIVAGVWTGAHMLTNLWTQFQRLIGEEPSRPKFTLDFVQERAVFSLLVYAFFVLLLSEWGPRRLEEFGVTLRNWPNRALVGVCGFLAAFPFVYLILLATSPLRTEQTQHTLLRLLEENPSPAVVGWVALSAAVLAPLSEELVFRVVLQGALRSRIAAAPAIAISSTVFALVHGFPDMLALLPLAAVFGYVYEKTHNYLAVVVMHATFNLAMLALTLMM